MTVNWVNIQKYVMLTITLW